MADFTKRGPGCDDDCEDGEQGERGERGERGKRGRRGHRGHDGKDGHDGQTGATGPTGAAGVTGQIGATGPAGVTENDAFVLVYQPGGVQEGNVYTDWATLVTALSSIESAKVLQFDDTFVSPAVIPPGVWDMTDVEWFGLYEEDTGDLVQVEVSDGASFPNLRQISGKLNVINLNNTTAPVVVLPTGAPNRVFFQLGFGPMGDNPQILNSGAAPFFDASGLLAGQAFVLRMAGQISGSSPAIQFGASPGTMALNLGGARIDANMIAGTNAAAVMNIGYTTGAVAFAQQQLWAGRIQRGRPDSQQAATARGFTPFFRTLLFPPRFNHQQAVPTPPSTVPLTPATGQGHNVTMRFNAAAGVIAQTLPIIRAVAPPIGSVPNVTPGVLDSDGMIVIVREFSGVNGVSLLPSPGETIEGGPGPLLVPPGGSRILQSDGVADWRIIAAYL